MKLPLKIEAIDVFYDGHCGMCCSFHEWVNRQERLFPIHFLPYQAPDVEERFPGVLKLDPAREMVVRAQLPDSAPIVYQGAEGWVLCLYALTEHRGWAHRLSRPTLLPVAKKVCTHLAANRHRLSKIFFRKKDADVIAELHRMPPRPAACIGGQCAR